MSLEVARASGGLEDCFRHGGTLETLADPFALMS